MPRHTEPTRLVSFRSLAVALLIALFAGLLVGLPFTPAPARAASAATGTGGLFVQKTARIWDTVAGRDGAPTTGMAGGTWYTVGVQGMEGLPSSGISAVQVNFEVINPSSQGVLNADKSSSAAPSTNGISYVNYNTTTVSNGATIPVGSDGKIRVKATSATDLRIDVQGYYTTGDTADGGYVPVTAATVKSYTALPSNSTQTFSVAGLAGVPSDASGVMLSIAETSPSGAGYLIAWPAGASRSGNALYWPGTQNYEFSTAVALGTNGQVSLFIGTGGTVNVSIAVQGYFTAVSATSKAGAFTPAAARVFDSRSPSAPIASGATSTVQVTGVRGVPAAGSGIQAVAVNIGIIAGSGASGHLQVSADDKPTSVSVQQFYANATISVFAVVPLGADGGIKIQNSSGGTVNVVVDVEGWFANPPAPTIDCSSHAAGSWTKSIPASVSCAVTAPAALVTGEFLAISYGGAEPDITLLSPTTGSSRTVVMVPSGGENDISAGLYDQYGFELSETNYAYGVGDWSAVPLELTPSDGESTSSPVVLSALPGGGSVFMEEDRETYQVSSSPSMSNPVWTSGPLDSSAEVPSSVIEPGKLYYWTVRVDGPTNWTSANASVLSTVHSFIVDPSLQADTSNADDMSACQSDAVSLASDKDISTTAPLEFSCGAGSVYVSGEAADGSPKSADVQVSDAVDQSESSAQSRAVTQTNCDGSKGVQRKITTELDVELDFCLIYGQKNDPTNKTWTRTIKMEWDVHLGYPSAGSKIKPIPAAGTPTVTGSIASQQQHGFGLPSTEAITLFKVTGNKSSSGYVVGGSFTTGSHSVKMADMEIKDPRYKFDLRVAQTATTPRFHCDSVKDRCWYENKKEAGL